MCSVIGYHGDRTAAPILIKCLKKMEYRGYDSVGISTQYRNTIITKKKIGTVSEVNKKMELDKLPGKIGIGHTRWATHGNVTDINAHPHTSNSGKISVVHNGIIENYIEIKNELMKMGYKFYSDTDSEVIANLLQYNFEKTTNVKLSIMNTVIKLRGQYAFITILDNKLLAVRYNSPLIIGLKDNERFIASDVFGVSAEVDNIIYLNDGSFSILNEKKIQCYGFDGHLIKYTLSNIESNILTVSKKHYQYFTLKEIFEQTESILQVDIKSINELAKIVSNIKRLYIIGSGTSYNAALIAKYLLSKFCDKIVEAIVAEEFEIFQNMNRNSALIAISQSGETADVINAVNMAVNANIHAYAILNIPTSVLAMKCNNIAKTNCGLEIGVAATKSFTSQIASIYILIGKMIHVKFIDLHYVSNLISTILKNELEIQNISKSLKNIINIYVLGKGIHYPIASECALKLKELSRIHAESMFGGELKHGAFTLIDNNTHVIVINPQDDTYDDMVISIHEIKSRGAKIIGVSNTYNKLYDYWIKIPNVRDKIIFPLIEIIPLQLLSYYLAIEKNLDPDHPKNLAKSVTVK